MTKDRSDIMKQLGLAILGQALPKASALEELTHSFRKAIFYAVFSSVLMSALALLLSYGLYTYLSSSGVSQTISALISTGILALLALNAYSLSRSHASKLKQVKQSLRLCDRTPNDDQTSEVGELFEAFMKGLKQESEDVKVPAPPSNITH